MPTGANCTAEVQVFNNDEFGSIRTFDENGVTEFCAKDIACALGYKDPTNAIKLHCRGVAKHHPIVDSLGRGQYARFITEPDVYRLITHSKLPGAQRFEAWVFEDVLPAIRRHGLYATPQAAEAMLADPDVMIATLQALKAERAKAAELAAANAEMAPKALFADAVAASDRCILVGDLAKLLKQNGYNTGQRRLFARLHEDGYLMWSAGKHMPTQRAMEQGLFKLKEHSGLKPDGSGWSTVTVTVTGKGQVHFINRYCKDRIPRNQRVIKFKTA